MKQKTGVRIRRWLSLILATAMALSLAVTGAWAEDTDSYAVSVTASTTEVQAGDTVTLTATVTKNDVEVTNLAAEGLYLWWWTDSWNAHVDGNSDAVYSNYDDNSGHSLVADVTLPSTGTYYIAAELKDASNSLAVSYTTFQVSEAPVALTDIPLENGDFESGTANWTLSGFSEVKTDEWAANNKTNMLNLWLSDDEAVEASAAYTATLTAGTYQFGFDLSGADMDSGLSYTVTAGDTVLVSGSETYTTTGWDVWATYATDTFTLTEDTEVTFALSGTVPLKYWGYLDNLTLKGTGSVVEADTSVEAKINVEKVSNLPNDFIMGMDISSVVSEFKSGVTYKDFDGNTIDNVTDFCKFLAECGVTHIRVRVWNDPFDASGNGYGGGNSDVRTAVQIAQGCAEAGLKLLVDFHYSDFWADPGKQQTPKAWAGYSLEQKAEAIQSFTTQSLQEIAATGAEIDMVQVGNETTSSFVGETGAANMCTLFSAGSAAIRNFDSSIKVVIHVTNPEKSRMTEWAANLSANNVDYDILATSYYPYWHGTLDNLKSQFQAVRETYGKDVMVAETSYAFTLDDTDGHDNTVRVGSNDSGFSYSFTPQGQAECIRDIIAAVNDVGGLGVFYWESAWITVGDTTGLTGDEYDAQVATNKAIWEQFGSGWASSFAAEYDPKDAGTYYGGSAVDNQAMFAANGSPLESINVWKYVRTGSVSNTISVEGIAAPAETIETGGTYTLPETVTVTYSSGSVEESVVWTEDDISAIDVNQVGTYVVNGSVTLSKEVSSGDYAGQSTAAVTYTLTVKEANLIGDDWSFENGSDNFSGLDSTGKGIDGETPYDGSKCLHWYLSQGGTGIVTYKGANKNGITLEPGTYTFECMAQGAANDTVALKVLKHDSDTVIAAGESVALADWKNWAVPTVSFTIAEATTVDLQMEIGIQAGGWGTIDCMYLHQHGQLTCKDNEDGTHTISCSCGAVLKTEACSLLPVSAFDMTEDQDAYILYRCVCGAEETVSLTAQIQGLPDSISLQLGRSVNLVASFTAGELPEGVTCQSVYTSSDTKVLRVSDQGRLIPLRKGRCELTYSVQATVPLADGSQTVVIAQKTVPVTVSITPVGWPAETPGLRPPCTGWPPISWPFPICQRV